MIVLLALPFDIFLNGAFEDDDMPRYVAAESGSLTLSLRVFPPPTAIDVPRFDPTEAAAAAVLRSSLPFFFFSLRNSPRPSRRDETPRTNKPEKGHTCGLRASNGIGKMVAMAVQQWRLQLDSTKKAFSLAPVDDPPGPPTPRSPLTTRSVAKWHGRSDEP